MGHGQHQAPLLGPSEHSAEVTPVHVLHRDEPDSLVLTEVDVLHDVGMRQLARDPGLVTEHLEVVTVQGEVR